MGGLAPLWALGELKPRFVCVLGVAFTRVCALLFVVSFCAWRYSSICLCWLFLLLRVCVCVLVWVRCLFGFLPFSQLDLPLKTIRK